MIVVSGLVGMPFVGEALGGFNQPTWDVLLVRWYELGAWLYPFFRNHCANDVPRREPFLYTGIARKGIEKAIHDRYMLAGVWYTSAIDTVKSGRSQVVPLWYEWPEVDAFHDNDRSVLVANSLLVVPVVEENATKVHVVKPPGVWYDFWDGSAVKSDFEKKAELLDIPVFVRGGSVVPLFESPGQTMLSTVNTSLTLLIATNESGTAEGYLYLDDGVSFAYEEKGEFLRRKFVFDGEFLKSVKCDPAEKEVPAFIKNSSIK
jgi:alpha 1,3-glucosidase